MNLLLCFFVLLFASSTVDAEKFQKIAQSMSESFSILKGGQTGIGEGILIASGASQLTELGEYYSELGKNEEGESDKITYAKLELDKEELKESTKMSENIERELAADKISSSVEVQTTTHYVQLTLKGSLLFDSARADLKPEAKELLKQFDVLTGDSLNAVKKATESGEGESKENDSRDGKKKKFWK